MALPDPADGTTVLITGASSGIGAAIARELAQRGHDLTLVARTRDRLEELAGELRSQYGIGVDVHAADVARDRSRARLLREVRDGRAVVGLVNSAGTGAWGRVLDHSAEEEEEIFRTNALALFDLTNHLVRDMADRGEGAVLNMSSIVAFAPMPQNATYAATKAFVLSYSEALHTELAGTGVSCTTINPGPTRTGIWARSGEPGAVDFGPDLIWHDAEDVAREAVEAMVKGRRSVTPGLTNKLAVLGYRFAPRAALLPATRVAQSEPVRRFLLRRDENGHDSD